jgi:hypothetical protein
MRRLGWKALAVVALAMALVPAASAGPAPKVKLPLVPLPKAALGAAGKSLALAQDSGVVSNQLAAGNSLTGTPKMFGKIGRVTGYQLTYGDPFTGGTGITQIGSGIELYKTVAGAKKGLAFWRKDDAQIPKFDERYGIDVKLKLLRAPAIGTGRFGVGTTITIPNVVPVSLVDERVNDGRYVLEVEVAAGSLPAASGLAAKLLRALDHRLQLAEKGRLRGKPVKLPTPPTAGPPSGGPDLATLALAVSDVTGPATIGDHTYVVDPRALSAYVLDMNPAGQYTQLSQEIEWYGTANEATLVTTLDQALTASELGSLLGATPTVTPVDLSSLGDNAQGSILQFTSSGGQSIYVVDVGLSRGQASDFALAVSASPLQASDAQSLAQAMATRLDAGVAAG